METTHVIPVNRTVVIERTLQVIECASCSIDFGIGAAFQAKRRKDQETFYCPNGHQNYYPAGVSVEKRLEQAQAREIALKDQLLAAVNEAERTRQALLRDRQRFANGVCPCCNRSFENVRRHMSSKHPDYDVTKVKQTGTVRFRCSCSREFESMAGLRRHQTWQRREGWDSPDTSKWHAHLTVV